MTPAEIPLLRESRVFASRLIQAARRFGDSRHFFFRRVNWSYRYATEFYECEARCFAAAADAYLAGTSTMAPALDDVFARRLSTRQTAAVLAKVLTHVLFNAVGRLREREIRASRVTTYRKCYVDDIELVFDPAESGVVRAVYPFPISVLRQLRYLNFLRRERLFHKLDGNPYLLADVLRFVVRRDVRCLMRMEARAQVRQAAAVALLGVAVVQLSDEFDIGSLDFVRALGRKGVRVVNSAHGVGKYFPVHAYPEFHVLTRRQQYYYYATRPCRYLLRTLNDNTAAPSGRTRQRTDKQAGAGVRIVFLSQDFGRRDDLIARNEAALLETLRRRLGGARGIELVYKPHPNRKRVEPVPGFALLASLDDVNGCPGTVFASFFSTCQIDPAFKGRKVLVRSGLIHPEIAFDESEPIVTYHELADLLKALAAERERA